MENKKILFFDTKPYDKRFFDQANKLFGFKIKYFNEHLNINTAKFSKGYDVVCAFVNDNLNKQVLEQLVKNKVTLIAMRCAGYNNVDIKFSYRKIHVVRVPGYSPHAVAEHAVALILSLNRKIHKAYYRIRDGNFSINGLIGFDLYGKTAGVIGVGKIGRCLIDILKGFGMRVLVYDIATDDKFAQEKDIKYVSLEELYSQSDVISLHSPLTRETHHMINAKSISLMKDGVMLINTGRGGLVNTQDLIQGLKNNKIGCAGLDVYEEESEYFFEDFSNEVINDDVLARLLVFPNVLVTSHQAFFTKEALASIAHTTLLNITNYFKNEYLENEICYKCEKECLKKQKKRCF